MSVSKFPVWDVTPHLCGYALRARRNAEVSHCFHDGCWDERERLAALALRKFGHVEPVHPEPRACSGCGSSLVVDGVSWPGEWLAGRCDGCGAAAGRPCVSDACDGTPGGVDVE